MSVIRSFLERAGGYLIRLAYRGQTENLLGSRDVEWSWVAAHLPENPGFVLDFGCGSYTYLSLIASMKGGQVTAFDRQDDFLQFKNKNIEIVTGDILDTDFGEKRFDVIINCSSIEHVGLSGRYDSTDVPDGDLIAMKKLKGLLKNSSSTMILTVPVGKDGVFPPLHRVYGTQRLALLLAGFEVKAKEFWAKASGATSWTLVSEQEALAVTSSESFYALGLFILKSNPS
jgi:SAM-dependent methyltransferase